MMDLVMHFVRTRGVGALADPEVAARLGLSEQQKRSITSLHRQSRQVLRQRIRERFADGTRRTGVAELLHRVREEANAQIMTVLTTEQRRRFDQLVGRACAI